MFIPSSVSVVQKVQTENKQVNQSLIALNSLSLQTCKFEKLYAFILLCAKCSWHPSEEQQSGANVGPPCFTSKERKIINMSLVPAPRWQGEEGGTINRPDKCQGEIDVGIH